MKILIIGGYGVFGSQLCRLLSENSNLQLIIAGRSLKKGKKFIKELKLGTHKAAMAFDRNMNLDKTLKCISPDLIIDASGPFQNYGKSPYLLIEACLINGINYMDFSDCSEFVEGVDQFNSRAEKAGIFILSGVSSFPILTAAVVRKMEHEFIRMDSIKGGIAPSPYANVGLNVIRAITSYAGKKIQIKREGKFTTGYAFIDSMRFTLAPHGVKPIEKVLFSLVDVPDLRVLPKLWPNVKTVWMGAGPAPETLHLLLRLFSRLVQLKIIPSLLPFASIFHFVLSHLAWGEHRGGMFVEVIGDNASGQKIIKTWHLIAEEDDGPFIPAMALAAVILRCLKNNKPKSGARSGVQDLDLEDYEEQFIGRKIFMTFQ